MFCAILECGVLWTVAKVIGYAVVAKIFARLNSSKIIGKKAGED